MTTGQHLMKLITILTALNPADAHLGASRLEAAGFHPFVQHEIAAMGLEGYSLAAGGILLQVPDEEAAEAKAFLNSSTACPE